MSIRNPTQGARAFLLAVAMLLVAATFAPRLAAAQAAPASPVESGELETLVKTLEDPEQRAVLVGQLKTLIEAQRGSEEQRATPSGALGAQVLELLTARLDAVTRHLVSATTTLARLPLGLTTAVEGLRDPQTRWRWLTMALEVVLVLLAAVAAEWLARRALRRSTRALEAAERDSWLASASLLLVRAVLDLACIAAFALAAYAVLSVLEPPEVTRLIAIAFINANVAARAVMVVVRLVLSPHASGLRLWPMGDETANYWALWVRRFANVGVYGYFALEAALLMGLDRGLYVVLIDLLGLVIAGMLVVLIRQLREEVARAIRGNAEGEGVSRIRQRLADLWHVAAILYVIAAYVVWAMEVAGGFRYLAQATAFSLAALVLAVVLRSVLRRLVTRVFTVSPETAATYPSLEERANRYVFMLKRLVTVVVYLFAALAIAQAWELDVLAWLGSDTGGAVVGKLVTIAAIVIGALVVWEVASAVIESYIHRAEQADARGKRLRTLLPLARKALLVVLAVMTTLTVLSELGIDIGPLLAGAGVVGLAIGFGAQTLVKDVITGIFILLEDSIKVGDVVEAGGHLGAVETLSIRTISLRDVEGRVHVVPFSDVTSVLNFTKDYSFSLLDIGVAYRENVDEVIEVLKKLGEEMQADEIHGPNILEPLQVLGLNSLDDSAVTIRARLKTVPGLQWQTRREFLRRMKARFDDLGIEIPFPHQTVWFGVDKQGRAPAAPVRLEQAVAPDVPAPQS